MEKEMYKILLLLFVSISLNCLALSQYYCTAADNPYFHRLMNLLGSIHKNNYENLEEIAVFDLGLDEEKIRILNKISKVKVYKLKENNSNLLTTFHPPGARSVLGWYAWKPVVIKESLEMFPYVLWVDAGTTVRKPINELFSHIKKNGYFVCAIGDSYWNGFVEPLHPIRWCTTEFVKEKFGLNTIEKDWVLSKECIMGGIVGSTKTGGGFFCQ